jgi:DNA-binding XRE family transcriptional regulator
MISSTALEKKTSRPYMKPMIQPSQIRAARAIIGLTQAALAAAAGISTTALNNIERGAADPKASTLGAI